MRAKIEVMLRKGVFDPQGKTILNAIHHLGFSNVNDVRAGKLFYIDIDETDKKKAMEKLRTMSDQLFANPVIEDFNITLEE